MVNLSAIAQIHQQLMYTDRCTIYVYDDEVDEDGAVKTGKPDKPTYIDVPCKISFSQRTVENASRASTEKVSNEKQPKILISMDYNIPQCSFIEASKLNENQKVLYTYKGQGGIPAFYLTHQEIFIQMKVDA